MNTANLSFLTAPPDNSWFTAAGFQPSPPPFNQLFRPVLQRNQWPFTLLIFIPYPPLQPLPPTPALDAKGGLVRFRSPHGPTSGLSRVPREAVVVVVVQQAELRICKPPRVVPFLWGLNLAMKITLQSIYIFKCYMFYCHAG